MNVLEIYSSLVLKVLLSIAMIYIAFKPKNVKGLLKKLVIFYLTSFAFGGCAFALLYFIRPADILMKNGVLIGTYPLKVALLGGIVGFVIIVIAFKTMKGKFTKRDMFCDLTIFICQKQVTVKAMLDTGNLLKEPISGMPVVVVEGEILKGMIPDIMIENSQSIVNGKWSEELGEEYSSRLKVIPFSSLGKQNGLLLGVKADYIKIETEEKETIQSNIIVGIYDQELSKNHKYTALVGLEILERSEELDESIANIKI